MNANNENMPIGDNEDQFTEGSYQAIKSQKITRMKRELWLLRKTALKP
jgi:hypothetical protein